MKEVHRTYLFTYMRAGPRGSRHGAIRLDCNASARPVSDRQRDDSEVFLNRSPEMTKIAERLGVEYLAGPIITTEHKSYSIVKAKNVEAVRNFRIERVLIQWNSVDVVHGVPMDQPLEENNKLKPIY